jgi:hypothetical protein
MRYSTLAKELWLPTGNQDLFGLRHGPPWAGLVSQVLLAWGATEAALHLDQSFRSARSTSLCASLFVHRARELRKMPGDSDDQPTITIEALDALGKILLPKIEKDAADGTLQHAPRIWDIVRAWKYLGGAPEAKAWLSKSMSESADFIQRRRILIIECGRLLLVGCNDPVQITLVPLADSLHSFPHIQR